MAWFDETQWDAKNPLKSGIMSSAPKVQYSPLYKDPYTEQNGQRTYLDKGAFNAGMNLFNKAATPQAQAQSAGMNLVQQAAPMAQQRQPGPYDGIASGVLSNMNQMIEGRNNERAILDRNRGAFDQNYKFNRMDNPFGENNAGLQGLMAQNRGAYGGGLQQALLDHRRNLAQRGITQDSGLAQNQDLQTRLQAMKGLSAMDTAAQTDNYAKRAAFDQWQGGLENAFNERRAQALRADDYGQFNAATQGIRDIYAAQQEAPFMGQRLQSGQAQLDYLRPSLQQELQRGQQGLEQGRYGLASLGRQDRYEAANLDPAIEQLKWLYDNRWNTRAREAINNGLEDYLKLPKFGLSAAGSFVKGGGSF